MTTIATDGKTIASDGRSFIGDAWHRDDKDKLIVASGRIYAMAGDRAMREPLIQWHVSGADPAKLPPAENADWNLLVVGVDTIQLYSSEVPYPVDVKPPFAIGSGEKYAFGAMDGGLSPENAIRAASTRDPYTGGKIQVIDIAEALAAPIAEAAE